VRRTEHLHDTVVAEPVVQRVGEQPRTRVGAAGDRGELEGIDGDEVVHASE
jgi:hypothetical protein